MQLFNLLQVISILQLSPHRHQKAILNLSMLMVIDAEELKEILNLLKMEELFIQQLH